VHPRKFIPQRSSRVNYDLYVANGNTIPTYGWLSLSLNLGLRREFTWRFEVADVTQPLIGADFLTYFGLLVDCRNNHLLDVTSLSTPAQAASPRIPSIKVINTGTSVDALLFEFPDLIHPTGVQRDVRHNTVHHIRTPPCPPVTNLGVVIVGVRVLLAADSQSTSSSGYRATLQDPRPDFSLLFFLHLTITFFFFRSRLLCHVSVSVTLRLTVSQSVCLGVEPNLGQLTRVYFLLEISFSYRFVIL
jgi:hypothetical protein